MSYDDFVSPPSRRVLYAKRGCLICGGAGACVPLEDVVMTDDYCDCVTDQLTGKHEWVLLADGDIDVRSAE